MILLSLLPFALIWFGLPWWQALVGAYLLCLLLFMRECERAPTL